MSKRGLVLFTILVFCLVGVATFLLDATSLSALGSIVAAGGSLVAVLWFSASLRHQSIQLEAQMKQLEEQRVQFKAQYDHIREAGRRDALLVARDILDKAEAEALKGGEWANISELTTAYMRFDELGPMTVSRDPKVVLRAFQAWSRKEVAASSYLSGVKSAAEIYLKSIEVDGVDFTKDPEEFLMIYSPWFSKQPFFNRVAGISEMLAGIMFRLQPGRKAAQIAFLVASHATVPAGIIRVDKVREDIEAQRAAGHAVPAIAQNF